MGFTNPNLMGDGLSLESVTATTDRSPVARAGRSRGCNIRRTAMMCPSSICPERSFNWASRWRQTRWIRWIRRGVALAHLRRVAGFETSPSPGFTYSFVDETHAKMDMKKYYMEHT